MFNKQNIIDRVQARIGGSGVSAEIAVNMVFEEIKEAVKRGDKVSLGGFGIFRMRAVAAKKARNPRTGKLVDVPAHSKVKFTPALAFKEAVNGK